MDIAPIKTRRDYRRALKRIERLMTAKRGTPEGDCLDVLVTLVEAWERRHYPLDLPEDPRQILTSMAQVRICFVWTREGATGVEITDEGRGGI
jgi:HTH-type transcriptional regulator / antitoxin HigA